MIDVDVLLNVPGYSTSELPKHVTAMSLDRDTRLSLATIAGRLGTTSKLSRPARDEKAKDLYGVASSVLSSHKSGGVGVGVGVGVGGSSSAPPLSALAVQNAADSLTDALFLCSGGGKDTVLFKQQAHSLRAACWRRAGRHDWSIADLTLSLTFALCGSSSAAVSLRRALEKGEEEHGNNTDFYFYDTLQPQIPVDAQGAAAEAMAVSVADRFAARGASLAASGSFDDAVKDFHACIVLQPRHWGYRYNRAVLLCDHSSPPRLYEAEEDLVKAILVVRGELEVASPHRGNKKAAATSYPAATASPTHAVMSALVPSSPALPPTGAPLLSDGGGGDLSRVLSRLLLYRGSVRVKLGGVSHLSGAVLDLQEALASDAANPNAWSLLSEARYIADDFEGAEAAATKAVDIDWDRPDFFHARGKARLALHHAKKGETPPDPTPEFWEHIDGCVSDLDLAVAIMEAKVERARDEEIHERAMEGLSTVPNEFESSVVNDPKLVPCWILRSRSYVILNQPTKALNDARAALKASPENVEALHQAACVHLLCGEEPAAVEVLNKAIELDPRHKQSLFALARCHMRTGDNVRAGDCLVRCIELGLCTGDTYACLASVRYQQEAFGEAARYCDRAVELGGRGASVYFQRAEARRCVGDYKGAMEDYDTVLNFGLESWRHNAALYFGRGRCLAELGQGVEALSELSAAADLDPLSTDLIMFRGRLLAKLGMHDEAEDAFDRGLTVAKRKVVGEGHHNANDKGKKDGGSLWPLLHGLAHAMYDQKKYAAAGSHFLKALQWATEDHDKHMQAELYYKMGVCMANTNRFSRACGCFSEALKHVREESGDRVLYLHERGKCMQMMKHHNDAILDFSAVVRLCPNDDRAVFRRAWSYKSLGLYESAAEDFHTARMLNPSEKMYALNYQNIGDVETIVLRPSGEERNLDFWKA